MTDLKKLLIPGILLLAFALRFYGVNWDQNQHLHPDERFLTMVTETIDWPADIPEYFDTAISPLNPHNRGFGFFVYGTFPVFFTKWVAETLGKGDYGNLTQVGRQLSAIFDLGTVVLVFLISNSIISSFKKKSSLFHKKSLVLAPYLSMFLYASSVLPIQLSHFYAVDTFLSFFLTLSFYFLCLFITKKKFCPLITLLLGISFGLAGASKITAVIFLPIIICNYIYHLWYVKSVGTSLLCVIIFLFSSFITIRLTQPYLFSEATFFSINLNQKIIANWTELKNLSNPQAWFPPGVQCMHTKAYFYPLKHTMFYGFGIFHSIFISFGIIYLFLYMYFAIKKEGVINSLTSPFFLLLLTILFPIF